MYNDHFDCDCLECVKDSFQGFQEGPGVNHADAKPASYYLDSTLVARKPVTVYKSPSVTSPIVMKYKAGSNIGKIYSWTLREGFLWWSVDWFSGKHQGWVLHDPSLFNTKIVEDTASGKLIEDKQAEIKKAVEENDPFKGIKDVGSGINKAIGGAGDTIGFIGSNMKWILLVVIVVSLAYAYKAFKT